MGNSTSSSMAVDNATVAHPDLPSSGDKLIGEIVGVCLAFPFLVVGMVAIIHCIYRRQRNDYGQPRRSSSDMVFNNLQFAY